MVAERRIEAFAESIGRQFGARRVVLFGSHARGDAREDSDVDLLVAMPRETHGLQMAAEIIRRLEPGFAVDLIVRSERQIRERIRNHDVFLRDAVDHGRVLYEAGGRRVGRKG